MVWLTRVVSKGAWRLQFNTPRSSESLQYIMHSFIQVGLAARAADGAWRMAHGVWRIALPPIVSNNMYNQNQVEGDNQVEENITPANTHAQTQKAGFVATSQHE